MKRKGFTLIELLAVIVVLAVIALIATPIVTKTIENSKRGAAIESVHNMIETAELYFITANPKYGKISLLDENLKYSGQKPELGEIELDKDGNSRIYAYVSGYCVTKEFNTELYASKMNKEECNWYATDNYETTEGTTFTLNNQTIKNYLIYGNSTQATRSGKNLFDYNSIPKYSVAQKQENGYYVASGTNIRFYTYKTLENYIGQTVTISFDLTTSEDGKFSIYQYQDNGIGISFNKIDKQMTANTKQRISATGVVKKLGTVENYSEGEIIVYKDGYTGSFLVNNIQFELGSTATSYEEYGAMPSPEYPSEVKSTGDLLTNSNCASYGSDACNNIGKYVVQVKNDSKNILNINSSNLISNNISVTNIENGLYIKRDSTSSSTSRAIIKFDCKPNTNYVVSGKMQIAKDTTTDGSNSILIRPNQLSGTILKSQSFKKTNSSEQDIHIEFNSGEYKTLYLWLYLTTSGTAGTEVENKYTNLMIEEGTTSSNYESYVEPKTTNIYLTEPLRKVGDYADYIDFENKKVVRNIYEMKIPETLKLLKTGDQWQREGYTSWYSHKLSEPSKNSNEQLRNVLSNRFIGGKWQWSGAKEPYNYIGYNYLGNGYFIISNEYTSITSDDDTETQKSKIEEWFKNNETYLYFPLATPTEETVDLPNIELLNGSSTLSINTEVSPGNVKLTTSK